jgi:hypothetical protein
MRAREEVRNPITISITKNVKDKQMMTMSFWEEEILVIVAWRNRKILPRDKGRR